MFKYIAAVFALLLAFAAAVPAPVPAPAPAPAPAPSPSLLPLVPGPVVSYVGHPLVGPVVRVVGPYGPVYPGHVVVG
ncbi:neuropeptide-like 3 [Musca domestica]|uniref:Neuropeptide-like 3 n=1 Tax=Musca domestica TaxID=7370 RepID=A0A1I8MBQ2_MUSDO|nr:neuropeptide-like 3 [Musca domestica]